MSTWVIVSWVLVLALTGINIFIFLKLKGATEQMMKMAFPNAANLNDAMAQAQNMMKAMSGRSPNPFMGGGQMRGMPRGSQPRGGGANDAQLKAAMEMLQNMQKGGKKK